MSSALPKFSPDFMLVSKISFSVLTPRSTSPVGVCMYGVPYINFIWWCLQNSLNDRLVKAVALSVLIVFGMPFSFIYCSKNFTAVWLSVDLQKLAAGHLLNRSIESKMYNLRFFSVIGPMKSNCISSFGLLSGGSWFFFGTGYVRFNALTGHFAGDAVVTFLLDRFGNPWVPEMSCRH